MGSLTPPYIHASRGSSGGPALDSVWTHRAAEGLFAYQTLPPGAVERLAAEHAAIARAFADADAARVRVLVNDHVRAAGTDALERLPAGGDHQAEEIS